MKKIGLLLCLVFGLSAVGCKKKEEVIIETAAGVEVTAADIDRDPLALLPGGAVSIMRFDPQAMFASQFGRRLGQILDARLPLPPSAGFDPARDLSGLHVGLYSMQGADFAGVASGLFDPQKIEQAADGTQVTPLGAPLVRTTYAGRTLYVSRNIGFVVLTTHTVLFGNETGIRRALDRIEAGRIGREIPPWLEQLMATQQADIVIGADLKGQAPVQAAVGQFPFLAGLETVRVLGNFQPPGMNFAGSLTYPDAAAASASAASLQSLQRMLGSYSFFMQLAGIGNPIQRLQAQPVGNEAQFVVAVDGRTVEWAINQLADKVGVSRQPIQATTSPGVGAAPEPGAAPPAGR